MASDTDAALRVHESIRDGSLGNSSGEPTSFLVSAFYRKAGARLYAFVLSSELDRSRSASTDLGYLANLVAIGHLDVGIDRVVDWDHVAAVRTAIADLFSRRINGNCSPNLIRQTGSSAVGRC